ncbi:MAG: hypothetical protein A2X49_04850 [Lentisphaerae bacterium GWF2_52_8]|nr:MAG: hypothetical protein A2X49_04850 [Lentisphaerae bacterium GWF2_52_8]
MLELKQTPEAGAHKLCYAGDILSFTLNLSAPGNGRAFIRTNLGRASIQRAETIASVEAEQPRSGQDWRDLPMERCDAHSFRLDIALLQTGHFEAKCCFFPDGAPEPLWPDGDNVHVNVSPAAYCAANSIYCAFVRQFGHNQDKRISKPLTDLVDADLKKLDDAGFTVIPPSGTFRSLIKELDHIIGKLKCRILHLLPVNPTPTVYARMGRYGCPYASLDFMGIDPALAEFDHKATPLDQFLELVDAVHKKGAKLFLDIAINHTGWASKIHETHPEWLQRDPDGSIHSPGAWGIVWGDLTELDHRRSDLWRYLAEVFLVWCSRGVDGFRCDAGYMVPQPAWEYIIARVRREYPDTVFLLEGLGGDPAVTLRLLNKANMNWAYSELFQNYTRPEIERYLAYAAKASCADGLMVHYAETHDNNRLAAVSTTYAQLRTSLSALSSFSGAFGFANGVEWFAEEKIDVHESRALNWGSSVNQIPLITRLNSLLSLHPAFHPGAVIKFLDSGLKTVLSFVRTDSEEAHPLLILANLDCDEPASPSWPAIDSPFEGVSWNLLDGHKVTIKISGKKLSCKLSPGQVLCLSAEEEFLAELKQAEAPDEIVSSPRIQRQAAQALAFSLQCSVQGSEVIPDPAAASGFGAALLADPYAFVENLFPPDCETPLSSWNWPEDLDRMLLIPPRHMLMLSAEDPFRASIVQDGVVLAQHDSLCDDSGRHFTIFTPLPVPPRHTPLSMRFCCYDHAKSVHNEAKILLLAQDISAVSTEFLAPTLKGGKRSFLAGNGRGGIIHACAEWGVLRSRYDALLLANLSPKHPEDRHIMWRRCRIWAVHHGRSEAFSLDNTESFMLNEEGGGTWQFRIPVGNGLFAELLVSAFIVEGRNAVRLLFHRKQGKGSTGILDDRHILRIIIRPDIEDRNFHYETKASSGPEKVWPGAISSFDKGFRFHPSQDRELTISTMRGHFHSSPEWQYSIFHENEASRGLEAYGDLFSPGYFEIMLGGGETVEVCGQVLTPMEPEKFKPETTASPAELTRPAPGRIESLLLSSMASFVVRRDELKTVVAGYPWFLDWGRDTLICARGLIAAGFISEVRKILLQFAKFAENGTLPNMICGGNASNRDTTDAPLWFFVACSDLCSSDEEGKNFLKTKVRPGVNVGDVLESLAEAYLSGTPNGIKVDPSSGLVFSPPHFTWMDTNHPACTPREGYPIEIQALWHAALSFLAKQEGNKGKWHSWANKVAASIASLYPLDGKGYLSDCLHASKGTPASKALPDDHLRSNQLFAITLGAIHDDELARSILRASSSLLVPGAIRSLADRQVSFKLPLYGPNRNLLNDPLHPYWGRYEGDEDSRRKPAYHNGTAWTWPFPSYCEAYLKTYKDSGRSTAKAILSSSEWLFNDGCIGHLPEIIDANYPHTQRGCDAQAWGITEFYRVWKLLH